MADPVRPAMSDAEREVLKVLWENGPKTVREVLELLKEQGQQWTRSTVITLLQRLEKKGYVDSNRNQFAFVFRAAVSREQVVHSQMVELADELCDGDDEPQRVLQRRAALQPSAGGQHDRDHHRCREGVLRQPPKRKRHRDPRLPRRDSRSSIICRKRAISSAENRCCCANASTKGRGSLAAHQPPDVSTG